LILPCHRPTATGSVYLHTKFPTCNPRSCREECRSKQGVIDVDLLSDIRRWLSPSIRRARVSARWIRSPRRWRPGCSARRAGAVNAGAGPARAGEAGTVKILYLGAAEGAETPITYRQGIKAEALATGAPTSTLPDLFPLCQAACGEEGNGKSRTTNTGCRRRNLVNPGGQTQGSPQAAINTISRLTAQTSVHS
jgi:hypothetical protein